MHADAAELLPRVTWFLDEPLADAAVLPTYLLSELTREHVKVVLTGEGADELLGGYDKYRVLLFGNHLRAWPPIRAGARWLGRGVSEVGLSRALDALSRSDEAGAYRALVSVFSDDELGELIAPGLRVEPAWERERSRVGELLAACPSPDPLDRLSFVDLATWLPDDVLLKVDRTSMAHGLEARVPFLDHLFARVLTSIPRDMKIRRFREKWILREAMKGIVPESIRRRRKHGFTVPVAQWLEGELAPTVERALSRRRVEELGYWNPEHVTWLRRQDMRRPHHRRQLWTLLTFDVWHRVFVEGQRPDVTAASLESTSS